jgi:uncharacterized membrane protein
MSAPVVLRWWEREWFRQSVAVPVCLLALLVPGGMLIKVLALWDVFALVYLTLTWLAHRHREPAELYAMGRASRRRRTVDKLFATPPEQLPRYAAALSLIATAFALPRATRLDAPPAVVVVVSVLAVLTSWFTLQIGSALTYLAQYGEEGGLDFPGDEEPRMVDFVYFAVAVGASFGTTDVSVTSSAMRRRVLAHSILAFFFNALILAAAVGLVSTFIQTA